MTGDLAAWLLERIAEDEAVAHSASYQRWRAFQPGDHGDYGWWVWEETEDPHYHAVADCNATDGENPEQEGADAEHIARWDPARILAECDAKRRIIARLTEFARTEDDDHYGEHTMALVDTLEFFALPYAGRPGYRSEWAP